MNILGYEIEFKKNKEKTASLPTGEVAYSEDAIIQMGKNTKYNPDDLIGLKGAGIYRRMMLDEQVKAVVKFKRDAITSREFFFEVDTEALGEEEAARRVKVCEEVFNQMKGAPVDAFNSVMTATWQGVSFTEKLFKQIQVDKKTFWGISALKLKPFDTFTFKTDEFGNTLEVTQNIGGKSTKIDINKFIHHVHNPEYDTQYGQSDLREAYRAWFSKDMAIRFYNMYLERSASGFKWINTSATENTPRYTALKNVISNSVNGAGMIIGKDDTFNIEFPSNNGEAFTKAIDKHDLGIARALLVPNLLGITPTGQTGSYSQSDTQLEAFLWTLDQEAVRLEDVFNEQLFRPLGELNFGDDYWPRMRFHPISERRKIMIINAWKDLVSSGAVKASEVDEKHLRRSLDMPELPEKEEDTSGVTVTKPDTALNGAQVSSIIEVTTQVAEGVLAKDSAIIILVTAFPINEETARRIIDPIVIKEKKEVDPNDEGNIDPNNPDSGSPSGNPDDTTTGSDGGHETGDSKQPKQPKKVDVPDETIGGNLARLYSTSVAMSNAIKRVDFKVMQNASEKMEVEHSKEITSLIYAMTKDVVENLRGSDLEKSIAEVKFDKNSKAQLQKKVSAALQDSWNLGLRHAENEIDKAKGKAFSMDADRKRISFISSEFFKIKSFKVAGNLADSAIEIISNTISNGVKGGKTFSQIEEDIYRNIGGAGFLSKEDYREALGAAIDPNLTNPQARIDTMLRTNGFEAINEARFSYFTDPQLGGFVQALEYSAVMDGATTQICQHLDGHVHSVTSQEWQNFRPPNHYNCRSILIPVTEIDKWAESDAPTMQPQKGFN